MVVQFLPALAKLFVGMLFSPDLCLDTVKEQLMDHFGPLETESPALPFAFSRFYDPEMGSPLSRKFIVFEMLIKETDLSLIKQTTQQIEYAFAIPRGGYLCRRINLDPGYLTLSNLVLATTKPRSHRISLGQGIYADLHLLFRQGSFRPLNWTYPDYRTPLAISFFSQARGRLLDQLGKKG